MDINKKLLGLSLDAFLEDNKLDISEEEREIVGMFWDGAIKNTAVLAFEYLAADQQKQFLERLRKVKSS